LSAARPPADARRKPGTAAACAKPRTRNRRGEGERLRAEIIEAATRLLARLGPDEPFSLRAVAKDAGISPPSVYLHFSDRSELLLAVLEQLYAVQIALRSAAEDAAAAAGGGAWERLLAHTQAYVRYGLEHSGHYKLLYEGRAVPRLADPRMAAFSQPLTARTTELIAEITAGHRPRLTAAEHRRLSLLLWISLHGLISARINKPMLDWPDVTELAEQLQQAVIPRR
jgi:AcrR family transcriptional regulator